MFSVYGVFKTLLSFYESCSLPNKDAVVEAARLRWDDFFTPAIALSHLLNPLNVERSERNDELVEKGYIFIMVLP